MVSHFRRNSKIPTPKQLSHLCQGRQNTRKKQPLKALPPPYVSDNSADFKVEACQVCGLHDYIFMFMYLYMYLYIDINM